MPKKNRSAGDSTPDPRRQPSTDEMLAAGKIPLGGPQGQAARDPVKVEIVGSDFFDQLKAAFGQSMGSPAGAPGKNQFEAIIQSQQAMAQAAKDITQEMRATAAMIRDLQSSSADTMTKMTEQSARQRQADRDQMTQLIQTLGAGGGGGGRETGHGYAYYDPGQNRYTSYGSLNDRLRARAASRMEARYGQSSGGAHESEDYKAAMAGSREASSRVAQGLAHSGIRGALSRVPYVGDAMAVGETVNDAAVWLTDERAKNAVYQSMTGGANTSMQSGSDATGLLGDLSSFFAGGSSSNSSGLGNRMAEEGFSLGQRFSPGGMTEADSQALFQGVTGLGYSGSQRSGALSFATGNYRDLGMNQAQSMQMIALSAQHAQTSLSELASQLQSVTRAARATGQSAAGVQQAFAQNYAQALQAGLGQGAAQTAAASTNIATAGGRATAGSNASGALGNMSTLYQIAAMSGKKPGQILAGGAQVQEQALGQFAASRMPAYLGQGAMSALQQIIQDHGGAAAVAKNPGLQQSVAKEFMRTYSGYNPIQVQALMSQIDPSMASKDPQSQMQQVVNLMSGNNMASQAANQREAMTPKAVGQQEFQSKKAPDVNDGGVKGVGWSNFAWNMKQQGEKDYGNAGFFSNLFGGSETTASVARQTNATYYNSYQKDTGKTNPVIEQLLSKYGNDPNIRFRVKTASGDKAVTFGEAIQSFADQLSSGEAQIVSSDKELNGQTVGDVAGSVAGTRVTSAGRQWSGSDYDKVAQDLGATNTNTGQGGSTTNAADASNGTGGTISVTLSPDVQKLFNFSTSGAVQLNGAAAAGTPAPQSTGPK